MGETSDDFEGEWANIPLAYQKLQPTINGLDMQIAKAANNKDDEIIAVMKSVRSLLLERQVE